MKNEVITELTGNVVQQTWAQGSKSEHLAVCVEVPTSTRKNCKKKIYKLVRQNGNPFSDPELNRMVGQKRKFYGVLREADNFLIRAHSPA